MNPETLFSAASLLAMVGWLVLLASPWALRQTQFVSGIAIPLVLSVGYTAIILTSWANAEGGFGSLVDVATLFESPMLLLGGWIHFLAFDLFIGAWQVRTARRAAIPFLLVVPCLFLTFMFGPVGLLAFMILRTARTGFATNPPVSAD
ncbi:ABA4-like family protein [Oricola sp.]|uniref:ABA4-like family protein n=1 Tax=Oricola sp. TaxID=1979950 RepID=UPI003BA9EAE4